MAASVVQPLCHHRDIGIGRIDLRDDTDQRTQDETLAIRTEQIERFIGRLHEGDDVCLEGEAGEPGTEMLGLGVLARGIDRVLGCIGILCFYIMKGLSLQSLGQGGLAGLTAARQKQFLHIVIRFL